MSNIVMPVPEIGMGYSSNKQAGTGTFCVNTSLIKSYGTSISKLNMNARIDFIDLYKSLGASLGIGAQLEDFGFGLAINYAKASQSSDYSLSYSFIYNVEFSTEILNVQKYGREALNEFGRSVLNTGIEEFYQVCGDQFIIQERKGAQLFVTFSIKFRNKQDKKDFGGKIEVGFEELFDVALEHVSESNNLLSTANIQISALQIGGNTMRLAKILGEKDSDSPILDCSLTNVTNIENCRKVLNQVIKYAENDFIEQSTYTNGSNLLKGYVYNDYKTIGISYSNIVEFEDIKLYLSKLYNKVAKIREMVENVILHGQTTGSIDQNIPDTTWSATWTWNPKLLNIEILNQIEYAKEISDHLYFILQSKEVGALICYQRAKCEEVLSNIQEIIEHYDNGIEYQFASKITDVNVALEKTAPFNLLSKIYIINVDCSSLSESLVDKYTGRLLMPIGKNRYYENSKFENINNNETAKDFYNMYELILNDDETKIESFKISMIDDKIMEYNECGEFYSSNLNFINQYFKGNIANSPESNQCIKALCSYSDYELSQVGAIQIELYEYDSPL